MGVCLEGIGGVLRPLDVGRGLWRCFEWLAVIWRGLEEFGVGLEGYRVV